MIRAISLSLFFILAVVIGIQPVFAAESLGGVTGFTTPNDIVSTNDAYFVVETSADRITKLDSTFANTGTFGDVDLNTDGAKNGEGELDEPYGIAVFADTVLSDAGILVPTGTGTLFVTDTGNNRVQLFDLDGVYLSQFGAADLNGDGDSEDDGEFDTPLGIALSPEHVYVVDSGNDRIQVFDYDGSYVRQFGSADLDGPGDSSGEFLHPRGIEVRADRVFVTDDEADKIVVFDLDGNHLYSFGSSGVGDGEFNTPTSITLERTNLFVADSLNYRIQVFDIRGNYLDEFETSPAIRDGSLFVTAPHGHISFAATADTTFLIVTYPNSHLHFLHVWRYTTPPPELPPSQHITGTATISQPDLPTITFNDATVDIALNSEGVGSVAFASLVDGTIVSTENLGSNVIQFILDPDDVTLSPRNPNAAGVVDEMPFQIPSFQTGAHTVVYNKTHFTFNFNDPTFTGTTPNVILQANIQSNANTLPAIHEDKANIAFNIITRVPQLCETTLGAVSLDFGTLRVGDKSSDATIEVENTGTMNNDVNIGADHWCAGGACVIDDTLSLTPMVNTQTKFDTSDDVVAYADKKEFMNFNYDTTGSIPTREGDTTLPFTTVDLFSLTPTTPTNSDTVNLQVEVVLRDVAGLEQNRFTGSVTQEIIIESDCN